MISTLMLIIFLKGLPADEKKFSSVPTKIFSNSKILFSDF